MSKYTYDMCMYTLLYKVIDRTKDKLVLFIFSCDSLLDDRNNNYECYHPDIHTYQHKLRTYNALYE